ncbi:MAG: hypothetical protein AAFP84_08520 [Actinomycetota bacterium]
MRRQVRSAPVAALTLLLVACGSSPEDRSGALPPVAISSVDSTTPPPTDAATTAPTTTDDTGADTDAEPADDADADQPAAIDSPATVGNGASSGRVGSVSQPADAGDQADRIDEPAQLAWVGGSSVVWDDRNLPAATDRRIERVGHRPASVIAVSEFAPSPGRMVEMIDAAVADGADGLIVAFNPSWTAWGSTPRCDGITPPYAFYACILEPPDEPVASERRAAIQELADAVESAGVPTFAYIVPHSTQSMNDPTLSDLITGAETLLASFDPGVESVEFRPTIITRGASGADEGTAFFDMVHPSPDGVELLADLLAPEIEAFFADQLG